MEEALIIFVRHPELGKVKTRIAQTAGDEKALHIYNQLLQHTLQITSDLVVDCFVYYSEGIIDDDIWAAEKYSKATQQGSTLGDRMQHAFADVFAKGYKRVCIIGSDCFTLNSAIINEAFAALATSNVVIGPALDGGYYLLGMQKLYAQLFNIKVWSSATVFSETMAQAKQLELSTAVLITLSDIDTEADWNNRHQSTSVSTVAQH